MRTLVAALLVGLLLVPPAQSIHDRPIQPAEQPARAFRDTIFQVNETISRVEEMVGPDPELRDARAKLKQAAQGHNTGNHWVTTGRLLEAVSLARRTEVEHENRDAADPEAAYFSDMESKWREARGWISDLHQRMLHLQSTGVDLWVLDHALLAGSILTQGERLHKSFPQLAQSWEKGQRGDRMKNGLAAFSYGSILHAQMADRILTNALRNQSDEPVGPVVGNSTLRGIMESLQPIVRNKSVSFDRQLTSIINGNMQEEEWLAALGSAIAWSGKQAPAAVQHVLGEPDRQYSPEGVVHHLSDLLENDTTLEQFEELGVPGAQARHSLALATANLRVTEREVEQGNATQRTTMSAAEGLGALSEAHTSLAILRVASGGTPDGEVIHLPNRSAGGLALDGDSTGGTDGDDADAGSWWLWAGAVGALGIGAFVVSRRRRD